MASEIEAQTARWISEMVNYPTGCGGLFVSGVNTVTAIFEAGRVFMPTSAPWPAEYERELVTFPGAKFDDQVGSTTQALDYFSKNTTADVWRKLGEKSFREWPG